MVMREGFGKWPGNGKGAGNGNALCRSLEEALQKAGIVDARQWQEVLAYQKQQGKRLRDALLELGAVSEEELLHIWERFLGIPRLCLDEIAAVDFLEAEWLQRIPPRLLQRHKVLPLRCEGNRLLLAMLDPLDVWAIEDVRLAAGKEVSPVAVSEAELEVLERQLRSIGVSHSLGSIVESLPAEEGGVLEEVPLERLRQMGEEAPIVRLVHEIIFQAIALHASDIHIEPQEKEVAVRYRIDGVLFNITAFSRALQAAVISRIKIMSDLDIAERRLPQDGRMGLMVEGRKVDFRVATMPTIFGEKAALRILDRDRALLDVERLDFQGSNREFFEKIIKHPHGIILITGPTGSGKTTTLYAILSSIATQNKNVITLEDPVEYVLPGINQVQINPRAGFTFASGLRAILRQDPDIIMVGEIRDQETARLAIHAALTGHLVLSTLHTNSAVGALSRLVDMGIEPFLISAALVGVVAQRLVRRVCRRCAEPYPFSAIADVVRKQWGLDNEGWEEAVFLQPRGCSFCRDTGYQGRIALQEVLAITPAIREMITARAAESEIEQTAVQFGMRTLWEDGLMKAAAGLTSLEEVMRTVYLEWV